MAFLFCLFITRVRPIRSWRGYLQPVSCPLSAPWRLVASTPFDLRPGLSREPVVGTKEITEERTKGEERACRTKERTKERTPPTPSLWTPCSLVWAGTTAVPPQRPAPPAATPRSPRRPPPRPAPVFPHPSRIEIKDRPAAPPVSQKVSHLPPVLPPPSLLLHLHSQDLLLRLPLGALFEEVIPGLRSVSVPPALRGGPILRPVEVQPSQSVPRLEQVEPRGEPLGTPDYRSIGPLTLR